MVFYEWNVNKDSVSHFSPCSPDNILWCSGPSLRSDLGFFKLLAKRPTSIAFKVVSRVTTNTELQSYQTVMT